MPIGKKPTLRKISFQRNSTIKRFGFPNDSTDCILRIRSLTIFSTSPISNKMWATLFFREHFSFSPNILPKSRTHTHVIKADRTFVIWKQGSQHNVANQDTTRSYSDVKLQKTHQVNNEDSQLKKEKWYETIQNQLSHHKQILKKKTKVI